MIGVATIHGNGRSCWAATKVSKDLTFRGRPPTILLCLKRRSRHDNYITIETIHFFLLTKTVATHNTSSSVFTIIIINNDDGKQIHSQQSYKLQQHSNSNGKREPSRGRKIQIFTTKLVLVYVTKNSQWHIQYLGMRNARGAEILSQKPMKNLEKTAPKKDSITVLRNKLLWPRAEEKGAAIQRRKILQQRLTHHWSIFHIFYK
jgi:hypothetical protein